MQEDVERLQLTMVNVVTNIDNFSGKGYKIKLTVEVGAIRVLKEVFHLQDPPSSDAENEG